MGRPVTIMSWQGGSFCQWVVLRGLVEEVKDGMVILAGIFVLSQTANSRRAFALENQKHDKLGLEARRPQNFGS